jgi:hypothetical protein
MTNGLDHDAERTLALVAGQGSNVIEKLFQIT